MKIIELIETVSLNQHALDVIAKFNQLMIQNPNMTFGDIAKQIGIPEGSLKWYIHAANQNGLHIEKRNKNPSTVPDNLSLLDQSLINLYDPSLSDEQLLEKIKAVDPSFETLNMKQMLTTLKYLAIKRKVKVTRNHPPSPFQGKRPITYEHSVEFVPGRFYDPIFTPNVNQMIKLARSGWSNLEIADEVNGKEYDTQQDRLLAKLGERATPNSVSVTLGVAKNVFGIDIPPVESLSGPTARGVNLKGRVIQLKKAGKTVDQITRLLIDERMIDTKDFKKATNLISAFLSQLRKPYRVELEVRLGRLASTSEFNEVLPDWLKIKAAR